MTQLAEKYRVHPLTVRNRLLKVLDTPPHPYLLPADIPQPCWIMTDASHFRRWGALLVTRVVGIKLPLAVSFHDRECFETVAKHLEPLKGLAVVGYTTDGKKGLVMAHQSMFPDAAHQRCLVHIRMKVQTLLTRRPKLWAGRLLLALSVQLTRVKDTTAAQEWWENFANWQETFYSLLHERTWRGKSWWYTHRNLRYAWKHVLNAGDSMFVFLAHPGNSVSHTNHLEGLFGQRKPALSRHRGLSRKRIANAILWTFYLRSKNA